MKANSLSSQSGYAGGPIGLPASGSSSISRSPDDIPDTPNALDDEFEIDGAIDAKWSWVNQLTSTAANDKGCLVMTVPATGSGAPSWSFIQQAIASGDFTVIAKIAPGFKAANFLVVGITLTSSTGQLLVLELGFGGAAVAEHYQLYKGKNTNPTTFSSSALQRDNLVGPAYLRVSRVSTTLNFYFSHDGLTWILLVSESETAFLTGGVSNVGLGGSGQHATLPAIMSVAYFRVS